MFCIRQGRANLSLFKRKKVSNMRSKGGYIDYQKVNVNKTACIVGIPPFRWDVAAERVGCCGNCEYEFDENDTVFCNQYFKDNVMYSRYYCNEDCASYAERERLRPSIQQYAVVLQDWKDLIDRVLLRHDAPNPPIGPFSREDCTLFVKLQRRIANLLQNAVACILKRDTPMYLLYKARLQEEWVELMDRCKTDAMMVCVADEMKDFGNICTAARFFVNDAAAEE